jgi:hypothetical protein
MVPAAVIVPVGRENPQLPGLRPGACRRGLPITVAGVVAKPL